MKNSQIRQLFNKARKIASQFAERCDFITSSRIGEAKVSCGPDGATMCVEYKNGVERAQIITAFTYVASLLGMSLSCERLEDVILDGRPSLVTINLYASEEVEG